MFFCCRARDRRPGNGGAGERHHAYQRVAYEGLADLAAGAGHGMQHVPGQDGVQQFDDPHHGERCLLARLEDDGVADGEGGCHLAAGVDRRPVKRDDLADHADGLEVSRGVDRALVVEVGR